MNDLIGRKFGKLTVIEKTEKLKNNSIMWKCKCECGGTISASTRDLKQGRIKSCGCLKKERYDLNGQKFGKLTVLKSESCGSHRTFLCQCECGNKVSVRGDSLKSGKTISCGCSKRSEEKRMQLENGKKLNDHTSSVFYNGTVSKNNTTGFNGISLIKGKYRASVGYKNKIYYLISDSNIEVAKEARKEADEAIKNGTFEEWIEHLRRDRHEKKHY